MEQLESLLAARRDERPEDGYWQDFLREFHQRQREESVRKSPLAAFFGSFSEWAGDVGAAKWCYGLGLAYAAVTVAFFLNPRDVEPGMGPSAPVNYSVDPAAEPAVEQLDRLDLSPSTQGSAEEQVF